MRKAIITKHRSLIRYFRAYCWLFREAILSSWLKAIIVLVTGFIGVSLQIAAIAQALSYAKAMKRGSNISFLQFNIDPRASLPLLLLVTGGIFISLLLSALMIYFSERTLIQLSLRFEAICIRRIIAGLSGSHSFLHPERQTPYQIREINLLTSNTARYCARAARRVMGAIIPAITVVASFGVLIYTDLFTTGLLFSLIAVFMPVFWRLNYSGALTTLDYEATGRHARKHLRNEIHRLHNAPLQFVPNNQLKPERLVDFQPVSEHQQAFADRLLLPNRSHLVNHILMACGFSILILAVGLRALYEGYGWEQLAVYLVALRYCLKNLQRFSVDVATCSRYYPMVNRYYQFAKERHDRNPALPGQLTIRAENDVCIHPNNKKPVLLVSLIRPSRLTLCFILQKLFALKITEARALASKTMLISKDFLLPPIPIVSIFPQFRTFADQLTEDAKQVGCQNEAEQFLSLDPGKPVKTSALKKFSKKFSLLLSLQLAENIPHKLIVIESEALQVLPKNFQNTFLSRMPNIPKVITCGTPNKYKLLPIPDNTSVCVMSFSHGLLVGNMSWLAESLPMIIKQLDTDKESELFVEDEDEDDIDDDDF